MRSYLDFEKPVAELDTKVEELRALLADGDNADSEDLTRLEIRAEKALADLYANLTPWQKTLVARHPQRPHCADFIAGLISDFTPLSGDRLFGEDAAILGGFARFRGTPVCIIGQEKGNDTESRLKHNFGMARPEGYRKAVRLMELAERFSLPVISLVDTAGAFPGVDAEERGQAEAIARSTDKTPVPRRRQCRAHHRRGRLGRRHRHRRLQSRADAGARDLHGRLARSFGLDPVA